MIPLNGILFDSNMINFIYLKYLYMKKVIFHCLVWQSDAKKQGIASLAGNQHLMSIPQPAGNPPALCIR